VSRGTQGIDTESTDVSLTGLSPCFASLSSQLQLRRGFVTPLGPITIQTSTLQPQPNSGMMTVRFDWFGLFPVRSPLLRELFLFLAVLRCFSSRSALRASYVFRCGCYGITHSGLPHSEIYG
jgi:hypothetical protein